MLQDSSPEKQQGWFIHLPILWFQEYSERLILGALLLLVLHYSVPTSMIPRGEGVMGFGGKVSTHPCPTALNILLPVGICEWFLWRSVNNFVLILWRVNAHCSSLPFQFHWLLDEYPRRKKVAASFFFKARQSSLLHKLSCTYWGLSGWCGCLLHEYISLRSLQMNGNTVQCVHTVCCWTVL